MFVNIKLTYSENVYILYNIYIEPQMTSKINTNYTDLNTE